MEMEMTPEAEIGHRVEDRWEVAEPQLSPSEKLNSCFEDISVASFPRTHPSQVIEIPSDASLADTVEILSKNKILSAPIRNVDAPEDASWIDKYIGIVEFAGIAMWLLNQSEAAANVMADSAVGLPVANLVARLGSFTFRSASSGRVETTTDSESVETASVGGSFFETLTSSEFYKNTKVGDISGSFRWAPFLALQTSDTFLTMLLLLSKYRMKSLPVVDMGVRSLLVLDTVGSYLGYKIPRQIPGCFHDEAELDTVQQKHGGVCVSVWGQAEIQGERNVTDRLS